MSAATVWILVAYFTYPQGASWSMSEEYDKKEYCLERRTEIQMENIYTKLQFKVDCADTGTPIRPTIRQEAKKLGIHIDQDILDACQEQNYFCDDMAKIQILRELQKKEIR